MENHITIEIPQHWVEGLDWEQDAVLEEVIQLGIEQLKIRRALTLYRGGNVSLGYVAEKVGLSKRYLIREARLRGIEPPFDEGMLEEALGQ